MRREVERRGVVDFVGVIENALNSKRFSLNRLKKFDKLFKEYYKITEETKSKIIEMQKEISDDAMAYVRSRVNTHYKLDREVSEEDKAKGEEYLIKSQKYLDELVEVDMIDESDLADLEFTKNEYEIIKKCLKE